MEQGSIERASEQEQNAGQVAPPAQLEPNGLGLENNELHHLAQRGGERGRAPGETLPSPLQATSLFFRHRWRWPVTGSGIESFLDFRRRDRPIGKEVARQHTNRSAAKQAKKAQNALQWFQSIAVAVTIVMTVTMNFVSGIGRARRTIPEKVRKTNLHAI